MKPLFITLGVLCLAIAAVVLHAHLQNTVPPASVTETAAVQPQPSAASTSTLRSVSNLAVHPNDQAFALSAAHRHSLNASDPAAAALKASIGVLVSHTATFQEKQAAWKRLHEAGRLDDAIEALKQDAKENPDSPEYAAMLGQAYLQKAGEVSKNGGSVNELGILGMSADQSFDNALKADPANWDAQFFKAVAMSYWPAELNKGDEVVQRLSNLINQQDTMPAQPEFSLPYIRLGDQYQKLGQSDNALQTWQAGAAKFPNDSTLQQKLTAAAQP